MAMLPWWIHYPYVNNEIQNLDWLLQVSNENTDKIENFIGVNTIKYADPILWDITSQYEANTIVVDPQTGDAYISTKAVPYGVALSNEGYWIRIYNYAYEIHIFREQIAVDEQLSTTATASRSVDDLVFLNGLLYIITAPMIAGDSYIEGSNCAKTTINAQLLRLHSLINAEAQAREDADTALGGRIDDEAEARADADTALGGRIDDEAEARADADTALGQRIDDEAEARADADTALGQRITDEATTRQSEDDHMFNIINRNLIGKKILVVGDSISSEENDNHSWVTDFRSKYASYGTTVENISKSGATFAGTGSLAFSDMFANRSSDDYDYIIIAMGVNDYQQQYPIGRLHPTYTDLLTFNGALTSNRNLMLQHCPNARIAWVEPLKSNYELVHPLPIDLYRMLIKCACDTFNWTFIPASCEIPFFDIYGGQIDDWTDGIHPDPIYCPILANYIEYKLNNIGHNYISYQRNYMSLNAFCTNVATGVSLSLEFDTNFNARIRFIYPGASITEAQGVALAKLPDWLCPIATDLGNAVINNTYHSPLHINTNGNIVLMPNQTASGDVFGVYDCMLNLLVEKNYS